MKVIIAKDGIKRSVEGEFMMCLSREDALAICKTLEAKFIGDEISYGWVLIADPSPNHCGQPNTEPKRWTD